MFFWRMLLHSSTFSHNVTLCKCNNGTKLPYEMHCVCSSCSWVIAYHENKVCKLGFIIFKTYSSVRYVRNLLDIVLLLRQSTFLTKCKIKSEVVVSKHFPLFAWIVICVQTVFVSFSFFKLLFKLFFYYVRCYIEIVSQESSQNSSFFYWLPIVFFCFCFSFFVIYMIFVQI